MEYTFNYASATEVCQFAEYLDPDAAYICLTIAASANCRDQLTTFLYGPENFFDSTALPFYRAKAAFDWLMAENIITTIDAPPKEEFDENYGVYVVINFDALAAMMPDYPPHPPTEIDPDFEAPF